MAKKDREKRKKEEAQKPIEPRLKPETRHGIAVVILFTLALVFILGLFDVAGELGKFFSTILKSLFGWGKFIFPIILIIIGYLLLFPEKFRLKTTNYLGLFLLILCYSGTFHLFVPLEESTSIISQGRGGGYAGLVLSYPFQKIMGFWASLIVLVALLIIALLVTFNTSLKQMAQKSGEMGGFYGKMKMFFYNLKSKKEERVESYPEREFTKKEILAGTKTEEEIKKPVVYKEGDKEQLEIFPEMKKKKRKLNIPIDLLDTNNTRPTSGNIEANKITIQKTLQNFGIEVEMGEVNVGPTVTQYTLRPSEGIKLSQITTLQNDLSLALAAHPLRMEAPIPGKSLVGIEVPNKSIALVSLREILDSENFKKASSPLTFALGKDVSGKPQVTNLDPMPHLLIAGATGSGKSVCINNVILSLIYANSPDDLKFILVDPKRVELTAYNDIPYLLTPVITEVDKTINALRWVVKEMDHRFHILSKTGKKNIQVYHREISDGMPYIVVIIDELADLMAVAALEVESAIIRLAQMARAVGIHLVVATQRPSVDVITGLIKANITARIAFNVASQVDSRTIIDTSGAEKLLGRGDMLFISPEISKPKRLQGSFVSDKEIERVVNFIKEKAKPEYTEEIVEKPQPSTLGSMEDLGDDELLAQAKEVILRAGKASASLLQRRLRIGYARAARILDLLEEEGFIGPGEGAKPREVLVGRPKTEEDFKEEAPEEPEIEGMDENQENNE